MGHKLVEILDYTKLQMLFYYNDNL